VPDYAVVERDGKLELHRANCPEARLASYYELPVMTMAEAQPIDEGQARHLGMVIQACIIQR
jgi:hypothetical protein